MDGDMMQTGVAGAGAGAGALAIIAGIVAFLRSLVDSKQQTKKNELDHTTEIAKISNETADTLRDDMMSELRDLRSQVATYTQQVVDLAREIGRLEEAVVQERARAERAESLVEKLILASAAIKPSLQDTDRMNMGQLRRIVQEEREKAKLASQLGKQK